MNLAFQTLTLLFLLFPGFVMRSTYNGKLLRYRTFEESFPSLGAETLKIILLAVIVQAIGVAVANVIGAQFLGVRVALDAVFFLLAGNYSNAAPFVAAQRAVINYPGYVLLYFLVSVAAAGFAGRLAHMAVRHYRLDVRTQYFRFNNHWHYLLSGETEELFAAGRAPITFTSISTIVATKDAAYLYVGVLYDYVLDGKGNLERIILSGPVRRRRLATDRPSGESRRPVESDPRFYEVEGDYFVLRASEMTTLNIEYWIAEPPAADSAEEALAGT